MHLLLVHQAFAGPDEPGGTRHFELARHFVRGGGTATILCSDVSYLTGRRVEEGAGVVEQDGVRIRRVRTYSAYHRSFVHRAIGFASFSVNGLRAAASGPAPSVVMGTSPPPLQAFAAYLAARRHRVPFIYEIRDLFWDYVRQSDAVPRAVKGAARVGQALEAGLCRRAARVIVNSPGFIPYVRACGTDERRIVLVANGVDTEQFSPEAANRAWWAQYGCEDAFIVLYAGALGMLNDLDTLVDAARQLADVPAVRVCLMGDGKERARLERRVRESGIANVVMLPAQPKKLVPALMASADVCVATLRPMPILRTVYPNKVFDYLACGRPVLLGIDGEIRKVVEAAGAGICVQPGDASAMADAIRRLAADPAECAAMGLRGRQYVVQHFDRAGQARAFSSVVEDVVRSPDAGTMAAGV